MRVSVNTASLESVLSNVTNYSIGFIDGIKSGKRVFLKNLGASVIDAVYLYIDLEARSNPNALHHVYEWNRIGSPEARLFDIKTTVSNLGLSVFSTFSQSRSVKDGSSVPFYNKAYIMENGIPVVIKPRKSVLAFQDGDTTVFTSQPVNVSNPGGNEVQGAYQKVFDQFFNRYFTQAFLNASGLLQYLENPTVYKKNIKSGSKSGKSAGFKTGYAWIINAKVGIE